MPQTLIFFKNFDPLLAHRVHMILSFVFLFLQGFGPELAAITEDDSDVSTRWRYFLRYMQGKVNQRTIEPFDSTEEGFRNFILFTFHPCITDTVGAFHMLRQFLVILDSILAQGGNTGNNFNK